MRSLTGHLECVLSHTLARCLQRSFQAVSRLQHQYCRTFLSHTFSDAARFAPHFFIRDQQNRDCTRHAISMPKAQPLDSVQHQPDPRFHVQRTRAPEPPISDPARHRGKSAYRINRIQMAQQQHWLALTRSREIHLQVIAKSLRTVEFCPPAKLFKPAGKKRPEPIDRRLYVAWRLNFHQVADGFSDGITTLAEVAQAVGKFAALA